MNGVLENGTDVHRITIPRWHPATVNQLLRSVKGRIRLKKTDRELIGWYARCARITRATGRRRVSLEITLGPRQRASDPDAYWKSLLDALVQAGLLIDDTRQHVELGSVEFNRGPEHQTVILLEDRHV